MSLSSNELRMLSINSLLRVWPPHQRVGVTWQLITDREFQSPRPAELDSAFHAASQRHICIEKHVSGFAISVHGCSNYRKNLRYKVFNSEKLGEATVT